MKHLLIYTLVLCALGINAQTANDTIRLDEVVKVERVTSQNTFQSPFTDLKYQAGKRLSNALIEYSSIYIKNYGNGQLSSITIRGTSATQTEIQWNGIRLNMPTLGQVDLSLFTLGMQDELQITRSGNRGVIGGTLQMNNSTTIDSSASVSASLRAGSFKTFEGFGQVQYGTGKVSGATRINYITSQNNFRFRNFFKERHPYQTQQNSLVKSLSFMQQFNAQVNAGNQLGFYLWLSEADRQIPPIMSKGTGAESQTDQSIRTMALWKGRFKQLRTGFTTAYMRDVLRYKNPEALLDETTTTHVVRNVFNASYSFPVGITLRGELNYDYEQALVKAYRQKRTRNMGGLKLYMDYYHSSGLKVHAGFRQDVLDKQFSAFAPQLGISYGKTVSEKHGISAGIFASRNFRFPTLNDLYWVPGGNPNLKQEKAWNGEISLKYSYQKLFDVSLNGYAIYATDWIQWVPNGANWSAVNYRRVFSKGFEAAIHATNTADITGRKFAVYFSASYSFTHTTNLDGASAFDQSKGKQLIYVPMHNVVAGLQLQYRRFYLRSTSNYISRLFISTDNSEFLKGYFITNLEAGKDFQFSANEIGVAFRINNLGNAQYQSVAQRPMPGRSFEGVLRFNFRSKRV